MIAHLSSKFAKNIRTHASFVGVILALRAIVILLMSATLYITPVEDFPEELQPVAFLKKIVLVIGIVNTIIVIVFWVGFLKRQRWCLTLCIGFLALVFTLQFMGLVGAMLQLNFFSAVVMLILFAKSAYLLLVTCQLRKVILDQTDLEPDTKYLTLQKDEFGAQTKICVPEFYVATLEQKIADV